MSNRVQSNRDPVELRSRQLRNDELELLWDPEWHIRKHDRCRRHLDFSVLDSICSQCQNVIPYFTSKFGHHHGCYVENKGCDDVLTFVEMPKSLIAMRQSSNDIWKTLNTPDTDITVGKVLALLSQSHYPDHEWKTTFVTTTVLLKA
jgi:hypothetical protein